MDSYQVTDIAEPEKGNHSSAEISEPPKNNLQGGEKPKKRNLPARANQKLRL